MREIPLTEGFVALVDDEDELYCRRFNWQVDKRKTLNYAKRHVCFNGTKTTIRMHRMITGIFDPEVHIDHIDGNGLNNQKSNLRVCTQAQNNQNKRVKSTNTSGYTGVNAQAGKWAARINVDGKKKHLGLFDTKEAAARAYDAAAWGKFGEFARLNFPEEAKTSLPVIPEGSLETTNTAVLSTESEFVN